MTALPMSADRFHHQRLLRQSEAARKRLIRKAQRLQRLFAAEEKYRERLEGSRVRSS